MSKTVLRVNHGKVFGENNWYTFHCLYCLENLIQRDDICEYCKNEIEWGQDCNNQMATE